jgi:hypothetical protein
MPVAGSYVAADGETVFRLYWCICATSWSCCETGVPRRAEPVDRSAVTPPMSHCGQTAKYSNGAQFFRVSPDNGHLPDSWDGSAPAYPGDRDIGKLPPVGAALNRSRSRVRGIWRVAGCGIIAPRRNNIAHLRRPWRATSPTITVFHHPTSGAVIRSIQIVDVKDLKPAVRSKV